MTTGHCESLMIIKVKPWRSVFQQKQVVSQIIDKYLKDITGLHVCISS